MAQKKFSKEELLKAVEESYALGYKHGASGKEVVGAIDPALEAEMKVVALNKSLGENGKKINAEILKRHRSLVNDYMKNWSKDADQALDQILQTAHSHDHKKE